MSVAALPRAGKSGAVSESFTESGVSVSRRSAGSMAREVSVAPGTSRFASPSKKVRRRSSGVRISMPR